MASDNSVELELTADTSKAKKSLDSFESSATKSINAITDNFKLLAGAAAAALAFVGAKSIISFLSDSADAAAANEAEVAKLEASLKSLGDFTPEVVQDFKDFADQLESTSKFSDDAAIAQIAFAKQLGITNDDAKKLVQTAADLASITGDSLEGAVSALTNSYSGQVKALGKLYPEVLAFTDQQKAAGAVVDFLAKRLGGAASEAVQTYSGALAQLSNAQEDIQKAIGSSITQNPIVIASIKAVTEGYKELTKIIEDNKDEISAYISTVLKLAVNAIPILADGLGFLIKALELTVKFFTALTAVTADSVSNFLKFESVQDIITGVVKNSNVAIANLISGFAFLIDTIALIPGSSKVFEKFGTTIEGVQNSLHETALEFKDLSEDPIDFKKTIKQFDNLKDASVEFGDSADIAFSGASKAAETVGKVARSTAAKIVSSDSEIAKSAKERGIAETVAGQAAIKASVEVSKARAKAIEDEKNAEEDRKKNAESFETFKDRILAKEAYGFGKLKVERDRDTKDNEKYLRQGLQSEEEFLKNKELINEEYRVKEKALRKKQVDDFAGEIQAIATNPIKVVFGELKLPQGFIADFKDEIAGALGAVNQILKGKEGATGFVAGLAGAFANAILPGIGGVVSEIVTVFAKGPEAVKAFVNDFLDALPEVITAVAESAPVFVEAFVDNLVNKGGAVRIGVAITKAMFGISFLESAGKRLFNFFSINLPPLFKAIGQAFTVVFQQIGAALSNIFKTVFVQIGGAFVQTIVDAFRSIFDGLDVLFGGLLSKFVEGIKSLFQGIGGFLSQIFKDAFSAIGTALTDVFSGIGTALSDGFKSAFEAIGNALQGIFSAIGENLQKFLLAPIDKLLDFLGKFKFPDITGTSGSDSGLGKVIDANVTIITGGLNKAPIFKKLKVPGFATGGVVPDGFPNDSFGARLSSREMVLPPDISEGLQDMIRGGRGSSSAQSDEAALAMLTQLSRIAALLAQPQEVTTTATIDGRALAQIILQLNRTNARLTA